MSKNILYELFGSRIRVKLLKFFYRNHPMECNAKVLTQRIQEFTPVIRRELLLLQQLGIFRRRKENYLLNPDFEFFHELRELILKSSPAERDQMVRRISRLGRIRLAIISGIFLNKTNDSPTNGVDEVTDLFIVGNDINRSKLRAFLKNLEAEVGAEIKFSLMEHEEFQYRYGMFDRFVRVLLEGPHEKIINRLGI